ncbi:MAG: hypothetical protein IPF88_04630 [Candidatus Microthrix sp.]|nr:hypothetical protein [Candidatus Microthrix sp.]MBK6437885.1 hypothetical protein [Candidatus Microthrix sp.]
MIALAATFARNQPAGAQDDTQASLCVPLEAVIDSSQQIQFGDAAGIADTGYVGELIVRFRPSAPPAICSRCWTNWMRSSTTCQTRSLRPVA